MATLGQIEFLLDRKLAQIISDMADIKAEVAEVKANIASLNTLDQGLGFCKLLQL
jgi:hypothetical protein